jgi:hypothetical protein
VLDRTRASVVVYVGLLPDRSVFQFDHCAALKTGKRTIDPAYDRVMVEEGLRSSNPLFSLFLGDFLGGFPVALQPGIELFELL